MLIDRADYSGHVGSNDFLFDQTDDGGALNCLTIVGSRSKTSLDIACGRSLSGTNVKYILERLVRQWGAPAYIRSDNGSEFVTNQVMG